MQANSRTIVTNQTGLHSQLERRVERSLGHALQKPVAAHNREAFERAEDWLAEQNRPVAIDAGCGVGLSTRELARRWPGLAVIGVDRSADRLERDHGALPVNALLVRADLVDFWRLARAGGWRLQHHYLLYPNPYPKAAHLKLRWHGHPVFPTLLALGGRVELRSNWQLYVEEFAWAVQRVTGLAPQVEAYQPTEGGLTPFERKYHASAQPLWRLVVDLPPSA